MKLQQEIAMQLGKKPSNRERTPRRQHMNTAGSNSSKKTRADVPSTPENKAATGKQTRTPPHP